MADEEQPKKTRSPKPQLLLLAIPGALPWLTVALYEWTDWVSCEREEMLIDLIYIQAVFAVGASIATFTVKGQPVLQGVVGLFNASFCLAYFVPWLIP